MKIYYLSPDWTLDIYGNYDVVKENTGKLKPEIREKIKNHEHIEIFTPEDFEIAFNNEYISDMGLIVIDK